MDPARTGPRPQPAVGGGPPRRRPLWKPTVGASTRPDRYATPTFTPPVSPPATGVAAHHPTVTPAPAATTATSENEAAASTKPSTPKPDPTTVPRPDRYQPRTRLPNPDRRFRSPLQNPGSSTTNSSKPPSLAYPNRSPPNSPASPPATGSSQTTAPARHRPETRSHDRPWPSPCNSRTVRGVPGELPTGTAVPPATGTRWGAQSLPGLNYRRSALVGVLAHRAHVPGRCQEIFVPVVVRAGIIARTLPLSPQATTVTYRCRRRIDVSSTNSTRHGRARRRCATTAEWALTNPIIRCHPTPWWRATARIDITVASRTRRRAKRRVNPARPGRGTLDGSGCRCRVGPGRPSCFSAGGFPRPALRTGRATSGASGSPCAHATAGSACICITRTRRSASTRSGHGAPVFTSGLRDQQFGCEHTGPLRHATGFPDLGLLRVLRPTPPASAGNKPSRRPARFIPRFGNALAGSQHVGGTRAGSQRSTQNWDYLVDRESDPNRFVRFVKGIWGVTTLYSGPGVLPGYRLPSQKGSSLK